MDLPGELDLPTWQKASDFDLDRDKLLSATRAFRTLTIDDAQYLYTRARVRLRAWRSEFRLLSFGW